MRFRLARAHAPPGCCRARSAGIPRPGPLIVNIPGSPRSIGADRAEQRSIAGRAFRTRWRLLGGRRPPTTPETRSLRRGAAAVPERASTLPVTSMADERRRGTAFRVGPRLGLADGRRVVLAALLIEAEGLVGRFEPGSFMLVERPDGPRSKASDSPGGPASSPTVVEERASRSSRPGRRARAAACCAYYGVSDELGGTDRRPDCAAARSRCSCTSLGAGRRADGSAPRQGVRGRRRAASRAGIARRLVDGPRGRRQAGGPSATGVLGGFRRRRATRPQRRSRSCRARSASAGTEPRCATTAAAADGAFRQRAGPVPPGNAVRRAADAGPGRGDRLLGRRSAAAWPGKVGLSAS